MVLLTGVGGMADPMFVAQRSNNQLALNISDVSKFLTISLCFDSHKTDGKCQNVPSIQHILWCLTGSMHLILTVGWLDVSKRLVMHTVCLFLLADIDIHR